MVVPAGPPSARSGRHTPIMKSLPLVAWPSIVLVLLGASVFPARADLEAYAQDFELLNAAGEDPEFPLGDDGWLVFGNVFTIDFAGYCYGYGPFAAPNKTEGFSSISVGEGGPDQGSQGLSVYSDYNNGDHGNSKQIEANVFQEQTIGASDVGSVWRFTFDVKRGNLVAPSTALAFIKTLDPGAGFATTNFLNIDVTAFPTTWETRFIDITIDSGLVGQLLQFGFSNTATNFNSSGMFYDNVVFEALSAPAPPPIKILSVERSNAEEFAIIFEAEVDARYELQRFNPVTEGWDYVFDITATSTEELLDDVDATQSTNLYRIIKL